jgi:hypothetical protein
VAAVRSGFGLPYWLFWRLHRAAIDARRRDRSWRYLLWSAAAGLLASAMIALGASVALLWWSFGLWWMGVIFTAVLVLPPAAGLAVRHVFAPLGAVRLAFYGGYFSRPGPDAEAFGLCCAAWAFSHRPTGDGEAWLARRRAARVPLGDAEVAMTALIAAGRGDADTARQLLRSIELLVEAHPAVRELVGEWLAADAAARGAWGELYADAAAARWPATPLTYFLEGVAARRAPAGAPGAPNLPELRARWLLAPHRRATRALIAEALAPAPARRPDGSGAGSGATEDTGAGASAGAAAGAAGDTATAPAGAAPAAPAPLPRAVAAHLAFRAGAPSADRLAETVRAWDAALADGATQTWLARRALELDAPLGAVDRALREVAGAVTDELARAADQSCLGAPPSIGPVGGGLARRLRHGRLDALEQGFTRWAQRRHDGAARAAIDEWREFIALRTAYADAVAAGGGELRRLAFPHAFSTGSHMAAWLWNTRREYVLSHAISKWLLAEAMAVGDTEAIELGHRNCSLQVPTRLGNVAEQHPGTGDER